jgi:hypothetical protein
MTHPAATPEQEGTPEPVLVRGPVEAVEPGSLKVAGRWFQLDPGEPMPELAVGQLVALETRDSHVERLSVLAEPEPHQLGQLEETEGEAPASHDPVA